MEHQDERPMPGEPTVVHEHIDFVQQGEIVELCNPFTKMAPLLEEAYLRIKEVERS